MIFPSEFFKVYWIDTTELLAICIIEMFKIPKKGTKRVLSKKEIENVDWFWGAYSRSHTCVDISN